MDSTKKVINVKLIQDFIDAKTAHEVAQENLAKAKQDWHESEDKMKDCERLVILDDDVMDLLSSTGIRTLHNKFISSNGSVIDVSPYVEVPAMWEFVNHE
jgi:hypothetical protein